MSLIAELSIFNILFYIIVEIIGCCWLSVAVLSS